ncbi:MAG: polysaccharide deacetylase family protein [Candidatus Zixiibacteriota bacterium]|nr:MAG: polysaccharide deacetylase family protein [candidate division Zixibacteria bacterium]
MSSEKSSDGSGEASPRILAFHKIQRGFSYGVTNYSPRRFTRLLSCLLKKGYRFGSADRTLTRRQPDLLAFTFDDGYGHLAECLPAVIERFRLQPVIFMPTAYIGRDNSWDYSHVFTNCPHLDEKGIKLLADLGAEFGSHGHSHRPLTRLSDQALAAELRVSRQILEDITEKPVRYLSYPFGRYDQRVIDTADRAGYQSAFTMEFPGRSDISMALGRLPVYCHDTNFTVGQKISAGPLYAVERAKSRLTTALSRGTSLYRRFSRSRL